MIVSIELVRADIIKELSIDLNTEVPAMQGLQKHQPETEGYAKQEKKDDDRLQMRTDGIHSAHDNSMPIYFCSNDSTSRSAPALQSARAVRRCSWQ